MSMSKAKAALCIKDALVNGATANTAIAVTGITSEDTLISVLQLGATASEDDVLRTSTTTITTTAGYVKCSTGTGSHQLYVLWLDNSA